jgi:hypothetical protein
MITRPGEGSSVYVGRILVEGSASDNAGGSGVQSVEVRVDDNGASTPATPVAPNDWSSWTVTIEIVGDGNHFIHAKVTDGANNSNENTIAVLAIIDNNLPAVQISAPSDGVQVTVIDSAPISVIGTASDMESGINIVEIELDNSGIYLPVSSGSGDWTGTIAVETNGTHVITARAIDNAGNVAYSSVTFSATVINSGLDKFGIKKIYPTAAGGNEWYVNMDNPTSDPLFRNLPSMTKQSDGSWQVSASQVRMEAWSPQNEKWFDVEITEYAKIEQTTNSLLQMYTRGGHHTSSDPCLGSAYKARLYGDGRASFTKEVTHPAYAGNRAIIDVSDNPLEGRWVGFKFVIYNFVEDGKTYVRMESYIDDDVTDANGNLLIANNWKLASVYEDKGGWSTGDTDFTANCTPMSVDNTGQYRQRDEILNMPGGTATQNIAAWRTDGTTWDFKYLSVREIQPPQ